MSIARSISTYSSLVKLSHTVFALPFALAAVVLASRYAQITPLKVALIVLCIAAARTAAMAFNRLVDRDIDAKNPRTQDRELPRGAGQRRRGARAGARARARCSSPAPRCSAGCRCCCRRSRSGWRSATR